MDTQELSRHYMEKYNTLEKEYENSGIKNVLSSLNEAVLQHNSQKVRRLYNEIITWNFKVATIERERVSLNSRYHYLCLPSVVIFSIMLDEDEKTWKFDAGENI